jgi:hypothetical protein
MQYVQYYYYKAAGQRHGDLGVYVDGSRLIVDVAVQTQPHPPIADQPHSIHPFRTRSPRPAKRPSPSPPPPSGVHGKRRCRRDISAGAGGQDPSLPSPASPVNRSELSNESGRLRQSTAPS